MKRRTSMGLGIVESADPVTLSMEDKPWKDGTLGESKANQLVKTLMYLIGVNFALSGGFEHKCLR